MHICFSGFFKLFLRVQMKRLFIALAAAALLASCSDYGKIYKSKNTGLKYEKAVQLYLKKDYGRALPLFDQLRELYGKASDSMEQVYYYTAYCHFGLGDFEFASMFFKDFTDHFTSSKRSTECAYMAVYCDYMSVGTYELDQSHTMKTIGALQTFINYNPESLYALKCNEHIDDLRRKLIMKEYSLVMQYYDMGDFRAAVTSAKNTLRMFPDMEQKEELEYLMVKAQFRYASNSIEKKRLERLQEVLELAKDYAYSNGDRGKHSREVTDLKEKAETQLNKLKSNI